MLGSSESIKTGSLIEGGQWESAKALCNGRNPVGVLKEEDLEAGQNEQDKGVFSAFLFSLLNQPSPDL